MKQHTLLLILLATLSGCRSQTPDLTQLRADQWQEDIRFFMEQAPKIHVNLYNTLPKSRFDSIGNDLIQRVPNLSSGQITAEMVCSGSGIGRWAHQSNPA